jgi:hypothetical protein
MDNATRRRAAPPCSQAALHAPAAGLGAALGLPGCCCCCAALSPGESCLKSEPQRDDDMLAPSGAAPMSDDILGSRALLPLLLLLLLLLGDMGENASLVAKRGAVLALALAAPAAALLAADFSSVLISAGAPHEQDTAIWPAAVGTASARLVPSSQRSTLRVSTL